MSTPALRFDTLPGWAILRLAMSLSGISAAASALRSILVRQDVAAHNLANVATPGFKRRLAGAPGADFSQGSLETATNAFDLTVQGEGLFKAQSRDGTVYLRAGIFGLDAHRELVTPQGYRLSPSIQLPADATGFAVRGDGTVLASRPDGNQTAVGQITLTRFPNSAGLLNAGGNAYAPFPAAGLPRDGIPGTGGFGTLVTGALEGSNVDLGAETVASIRALRTFQVNARMIRAQDDMLGTLLDVRH